MKRYNSPDGPVTEWNGIKLRIIKCRSGYSIHYYSAELLEGEWPADNDLITLCDGDDPQFPRHFGGHVRKSGKTASVDVYVD